MKNIRIGQIHYTNTKLLQKFLTPSGSIIPRAKTGLSAKLQTRVSRELKRARHLALLPYVSTL